MISKSILHGEFYEGNTIFVDVENKRLVRDTLYYAVLMVFPINSGFCGKCSPYIFKD